MRVRRRADDRPLDLRLMGDDGMKGKGTTACIVRQRCIEPRRWA